ncbi:MAG: hypothetical protein ACE5JM_18030, partial [Armatimonadota bacterium]
AEPPGQEFGNDDLLRGDVPSPATAQEMQADLAQALRPAYIESVVVQGNHQEDWSYNFGLNEQQMGYDVIVNYRADGEGETMYEASDYWQVYIIGAYESPWADKDNDADSETAAPGATVAKEPEGSLLFTEIWRDYAAQWMAEQDPAKKWSAQQATSARRGVVVHELGHQFVGGDHHTDVGPDGKPYCLMWTPSSDQVEWLAKHLPMGFCDTHLDEIRDSLRGGP